MEPAGHSRLQAFFRGVVMSLVAVLPMVMAPLVAEATLPGHNGRIAFFRFLGSPSVIETIRPDGSNRKILPTGRQAFDPAWSPNGNRIAYVVFEGRHHQACGSRARTGRIASPSWPSRSASSRSRSAIRLGRRAATDWRSVSTPVRSSWWGPMARV